MYIRKTTDTYELYGDYGFGLDLLCCCSTRQEAKDNKLDYLKNDNQVKNLTIKKKREKN